MELLRKFKAVLIKLHIGHLQNISHIYPITLIDQCLYLKSTHLYVPPPGVTIKIKNIITTCQIYCNTRHHVKLEIIIIGIYRATTKIDYLNEKINYRLKKY